MKLAVIGLGLIGGSLSVDLKRLGFAEEVIGVDNDLAHCKQALDLSLVDRIGNLESDLQEVDMVILAVPVDAILKILPEILDLVKSSTTVIDMGSTKELICQAVEGHKHRKQFVPSHPMAGSESSGPSAAVAGLFFKKTAIICDPSQSGEYHLSRAKSLYSALHMKLIFMSPAEHDVHAAYVSHLSHVSAFALANTVLEKRSDLTTLFDFAGGGFVSAVRLAKSSPTMWSPIFEQNCNHVIDALDSYIDHLKLFQKSLVTRKFEETRMLMAKANQIKQALHAIHQEGGLNGG